MTRTKGATFLVYRHVESELASEGKCEGLLDSPVSESGKAQLRDLFIPHSHYLPVTAIFSSPQVRATAVADRLAAELDVPMRVVPQLRARGLGVFQGRTWADLATNELAHFSRCFEDEDVAPRKGETRRQVATRVLSVVDSLAATSPGGRIVLVTHQEAIRIITERYGVRWPLRRLDVTHGSFTVAQVNPGDRRRSLRGEQG